MSDHSPRRDRNGGSRNRSYSPRRRGSGDRRSRDKGDRQVKDDDNFTQIYVAKLSRRTREEDLKSEFIKYGKIKELCLKAAYAFIDYEDHDSAVKAIEAMHGRTFVNGEELVVE
jgi:RNA recognition motif-containing protein